MIWKDFWMFSSSSQESPRFYFFSFKYLITFQTLHWLTESHMSIWSALIRKVVAHRFPGSSSPGFVIYLEGCKTDFHPRSKERNGSILSKYKARSRGRGRSIGFKGEREKENEEQEREREREKTGEKFWDRKRGAVRLERLRGIKTLGFLNLLLKFSSFCASSMWRKTMWSSKSQLFSSNTETARPHSFETLSIYIQSKPWGEQERLLIYLFSSFPLFFLRKHSALCVCVCVWRTCLSRWNFHE